MSIADSGQRRQFESGAVRDIQVGKGRMDLIPLDVMCEFLSKFSSVSNHVLDCVKFIYAAADSVDPSSQCSCMFEAAKAFCKYRIWSPYDAMLELSIHYEEGARKYGEHNWEKGLPLSSYLDSMLRHLMKCCNGLHDENHDRAVLWNMFGYIWTVNHCDNKTADNSDVQ